MAEQTVGLLPFALSQEDGEDGTGTHGEDDCDGKEQVQEGRGQVDRAHGVLAYSTSHEQSIHNGVQRKDHQGGYCSGGEADELRE